MRVLGISGSLRRDSYNTALLLHAGDLFEAEGAEFEIYDGLRDVPPYDEDCDSEDAPEAVSRIRDAVRDADAVFFVTPEYNSSIPGALKNALDWISRPLATNALRYKPVAVIGVSSGVFGAVWAQADLRKVLGAIGARVTEGEVAVGNAGERVDENGRLNEPNLEQEVHEVVATLLSDAQAAQTSQPALASSSRAAGRLRGQQSGVSRDRRDARPGNQARRSQPATQKSGGRSHE